MSAAAPDTGKRAFLSLTASSEIAILNLSPLPLRADRGGGRGLLARIRIRPFSCSSDSFLFRRLAQTFAATNTAKNNRYPGNITVQLTIVFCSFLLFFFNDNTFFRKSQYEERIFSAICPEMPKRRCPDRPSRSHSGIPSPPDRHLQTHPPKEEKRSPTRSLR